MSYTFSMHVNAPPDKVFGIIDDPEQLKRWCEGVEETIYVTPKDPVNPVGTKFKQKIREGGQVQEYDGEVTAYDRPRHLGVCISNPHFAVQVDYRLAAEEGGSRLDYSADFQCRSMFMRVMLFLFGWYTRRILRRQMAKLKELAETGA
jgi:uncharacterized protein YndB with AHSA1/START domain